MEQVSGTQDACFEHADFTIRAVGESASRTDLPGSTDLVLKRPEPVQGCNVVGLVNSTLAT